MQEVACLDCFRFGGELEVDEVIPARLVRVQVRGDEVETSGTEELGSPSSKDCPGDVIPNIVAHDRANKAVSAIRA